MEAFGALLDEYKLYFGIGAAVGGAIWAWIRLRKPKSTKEMRQSSGAHSTNLQAGRDITIPSNKGEK